jgi:hypothetical protein
MYGVPSPRSLTVAEGGDWPQYCRSRRQPLVQFRHERQEPVTEQQVGMAQAAVLAEPAIFEVLRLDGETCRDVSGHAVEPCALLGRECLGAFFDPGIVAFE